MGLTVTLKDNYKNLSESNQQTIFYMGKIIKEKGTTEFQIGETVKFFEKVSQDQNAAISTVRRLYYSYVNKHTYEELVELSNYYRTANGLVIEEPTINLNKGKNKLVMFKTKLIPVHEENGNYYFVLDELLQALPISKTNKALKNSLSVKGRKIIEIDGESKQCIDVEKVKAFLQSFLRQIVEGEQKDDIRIFLENIHQLSLKTTNTYAQPVPAVQVKELKPIPKENKVEIVSQQKVEPERVMQVKNNKVQVEKIKEVKAPTTKPKTVSDAQPIPLSEAKMLKEFKDDIAKADAAKSEFNIDETEEMKALTKILNNNIGYLSQEAKEKLYNLTLSNGLVNTVVATLGMLTNIQKDTSMYFVNKIEEQLKVCL